VERALEFAPDDAEARQMREVLTQALRRNE
jgi:hypothetical protein